VSQSQQLLQRQRVKDIRAELISTYFKPKVMEKLIAIAGLPFIQQRRKPVPLKGIDDMLTYVETTELKAPKPLTMVEIYENKLKKSIAQSRLMLKRTACSLEGQSIIHATLFKNNRLVEAFIDSCRHDKARVEIVNTTDQLGRTALHYASYLGLKQVLFMLFSAGSDPRRRDLYGRTCLHYAAMKEDPSVLEVTLQELKTAKEARGRASETSNSNTVAERLKYLSLKKLLGKVTQAEPSTEPLFEDIGVKVDLTEFMTELGEMKQVEQHLSVSFLKASVPFDNIKFIDLQDEEGLSALHIAAMRGCSGVVRVLLDQGANLYLEDRQHRRSIELTSSPQVAQLLMQKGHLVGPKIMSRSPNAW
jgi:hypothetical protein